MQLFAGLEALGSSLQGLKQIAGFLPNCIQEVIFINRAHYTSVWLRASLPSQTAFAFSIDLNNTNMNRDELNNRAGVTNEADASAMLPPLLPALPQPRRKADAGVLPFPDALPQPRLKADARVLPRAQGSSLPHIRNGMSASPWASAATKPSDDALGLPRDASACNHKRAAHALMELAGAKRAKIDMENGEQRKPKERTGKRLVGVGYVGFNGSVLFRSHMKYNLIKSRNLTLEQYVELMRSAKVARNDAHKSIRTHLPKKVQENLGTKEHGRNRIHCYLVGLWRNMSDDNKKEYNRCARDLRHVLE